MWWCSILTSVLYNLCYALLYKIADYWYVWQLTFMRGFHTAWSWKLVLNCCTERDRLWRHLRRHGRKRQRSIITLFSHHYLVKYFNPRTKPLIDGLTLNRRYNKKDMDCSYTCNKSVISPQFQSSRYIHPLETWHCHSVNVGSVLAQLCARGVQPHDLMEQR